MQKNWMESDIGEFISQYGINLLVDNAPIIKYSTKEKEHGSKSSLLGIFILLAALISCIVSWIFFFAQDVYYFILFLFLIIFSVLLIPTFLRSYLKSRVNIKPIECWIEIHEILKNQEECYYCLTYYPIFSGKVHPNKGKDILLKLYHDQILEDTLDITQIEIYFKKDPVKHELSKIGYHFQHDNHEDFWNDEFSETPWEFFALEDISNYHALIVANWMHQYEWDKETNSNIEKMEDLSPWEVKTWDSKELKPLTEEFKNKIHWNERGLNSLPKLIPWDEQLKEKAHEIKEIQFDIQEIEKAIEKILGKDTEIRRFSDIEKHLNQFRIYFRDLNFEKSVIKDFSVKEI